MILIQAFSRRETLFLFLYRLYCRRLGASSSKAVEQREYSSSLVRRGGLKAAPLKTSMTPAESQIRSPTAVIPLSVYSASLSLSETRTGTSLYHIVLPKSALLYLRLGT